MLMVSTLTVALQFNLGRLYFDSWEPSSLVHVHVFVTLKIMYIGDNIFFLWTKYTKRDPKNNLFT